MRGRLRDAVSARRLLWSGTFPPLSLATHCASRRLSTLSTQAGRFAAMGFQKPPVGAHVTDVWGGDDLGVVGSSISLVVPPNGASRFVLLG